MDSIKRSYQEKSNLRKVHTQKDPDAFAFIYDAYVEKIYRFVLFKLSSKEEAEDVTSTVFMKAWDYLTSEKGKEVKSISGFLYTIARRLVVDAYRTRARKQTTSLDGIDVRSDEDIESIIHASQEHKALIRSLRTMKQAYQEVIMLRFIEELTIAEIAEVLKKKQTNVRVLLHRAMKKLQDIHLEE